MDISRSLALTMAGAPIPPSRTSSLRTPINGMSRSNSTKEISLYKGVSDRSFGWKPRNSPLRNPTLGPVARDISVRRWDGAARRSTDWDGLRRDPELWYPEGNCLVHLYGRGQSRRGPALRVPMGALLAANCRPLLDRFMVDNFNESPISDSSSSSEDGGYFSQPNHRMYELYIPAPPTAERGQAFHYHTATRNFFAWVFGKSLVGSHLGGALVGLLNSMSQFRLTGVDNIEGIMGYMDEEGYADMRNQPDHALAVLYFAEHFQFKDMWIDAFAHCTGMNERLITCLGFEHLSRTSRALITRSRLEMDMRLDHIGRRLSSFLSDDLSEAHLGLSASARAHLDKFRSFLQSYYVAKLGYYPPASCEAGSASFPKNIYGQMCTEFQKLYDYLVDPQLTHSDSVPVDRQGGICVWQNVQAFDQRHKYQPLVCPYPLLPEGENSQPKPTLSKRLSWAPGRTDKMKPDPRLVAFSSLTKATNHRNSTLYECTLVRAYRGFEKECVFSPIKGDKRDKLSQTEARKVRWILVYTILQTLIAATKAPEQVRDTQNVPYNLCVLTAGCPPWKEHQPSSTFLRTQTDQGKEDFNKSLSSLTTESDPSTPIDEIKPDIDYFALMHRPQPERRSSESTTSLRTSKAGTVRKALSTLGNMPELQHPRPKRASFHEILVHGYGNGTNKVNITAGCAASTAPVPEPETHQRKLSTDSGSSMEDMSSRWSNSSVEAPGADSPRTSVSSRRASIDTIDESKQSIKDFLNRPMSALGLCRVYSESIYSEASTLQPDPLQVRKNTDGDYVRVTKQVKVHWDDEVDGEANDEWVTYLNT